MIRHCIAAFDAGPRFYDGDLDPRLGQSLSDEPTRDSGPDDDHICVHFDTCG